MAQDSDVARMAAALRTPSLRYRSFGNEAVRNPPAEPPQEGPENFPLLGEALAEIESIPPETALRTDREPSPAPVRPDLPAMVIPESSDARDTFDTRPAPAPVSYVPSPPPRPEPHQPLRPEPAPYVPSAAPVYVAAPYAPALPMSATPAPVPVIPPAVAAPLPPAAAATPPGQTLLQTLLAEAPPRAAPPDGAPIVVGRHPPQTMSPPPRPPAPTIAAGEPILPLAPPVITTRGLAPPLPPLPAAPDRGAAGTPRMTGPGTGSSLLDMLVGRGDASQSAAQYPLLDALTTAMRSDLGGASSRVWPAARVEMALPELLRRIAAGVRTGRGLN